MLRERLIFTDDKIFFSDQIPKIKNQQLSPHASFTVVEAIAVERTFTCYMKSY